VSPSPNDTTVIEGIVVHEIAERGPAPVQARKGRARVFKVVNQAGEVVGLATHGKVLEGAARAAEIELEVRGERRPEWILCVDCKSLVRVTTSPRIPIPSRCRKHADDDDLRRSYADCLEAAKKYLAYLDTLPPDEADRQRRLFPGLLRDPSAG